jgi:hypothetical protein
LKKIYKGISKYKPNFFGGFKDEEKITVYINELKCNYFQRMIIDEDMKSVDLTYVSLNLEKKKFKINTNYTFCSLNI